MTALEQLKEDLIETTPAAQWEHWLPLLEAVIVAARTEELVALGKWMGSELDMGADRSQVADPAILARRDVHNRIVARIAELKESK